MMHDKYIAQRLPEAGATLMILPRPEFSRSLVLSALVQHNAAHYAVKARLSPTNPEIIRCAQVMGWLNLMPARLLRLRRIIEMRMLTCPITQRPLYSWRKIGRTFRVDHHTAQRWHSAGVALLAAAIRADLEMQDRGMAA